MIKQFPTANNTYSWFWHTTALACFVQLLFPADGLSVQRPISHTWSPLQINIQCQSPGRTKSCPTFLKNFIEESPLLKRSPRGTAQVQLIVNSTSLGNQDKLLLRFISNLENTPPSYEVKVNLDTRSTDETQRKILQSHFERGISLYLEQLIPGTVNISITPPLTGSPNSTHATSPWSIFAWLGGNGDWSDTSQKAHAWSGLGFKRITKHNRIGMSLGGGYGISRRPPIKNSDGSTTSLNSESHNLKLKGLAVVNISDHWSTGFFLRGGHQDFEGRYSYTARVHTGISFDLFPSNDPRGNAFAVAYLVGYQDDHYNIPNDLGQLKTSFATHALLAEASVRHDTQTYKLNIRLATQLLSPKTRYVIAISPEIDFQLGAHVDLRLQFGITQQQVPGPGSIDPTNYELIERSSYSDPLKLRASFNILFHWDRSNNESNNRWNLVRRMDELHSL